MTDAADCVHRWILPESGQGPQVYQARCANCPAVKMFAPLAAGIQEGAYGRRENDQISIMPRRQNWVFDQ